MPRFRGLEAIAERFGLMRDVAPGDPYYEKRKSEINRLRQTVGESEERQG